MTGKRTRKPVRRDNWDDDESEQEEDPFGTDESDEWIPNTEDAESEYTQLNISDD